MDPRNPKLAVECPRCYSEFLEDWFRENMHCPHCGYDFAYAADLEDILEFIRNL